MLRVFVSSTSKDLTTHREVLKDALLKMGLHPVMQEHFPAMDADAVAGCKQLVESCDLFVGVYAHRYGFVPNGYGKSITELEYEWAAAKGIPIQAFVVDPTYDWPNDTDHREQAHPDLLQKFKARIDGEHIRSQFTTPESLALAVSTSLANDVKHASREQTRQRRLFITVGSIITLLLVGIIASIVIFANPDEIKQADRVATNEAVAYDNETSTATQWTPTPTATNSATPTATFTPSTTPLAREPAADEEVLVVVAQFNVIDPTAPRADQNLISEFEAADINFIALPYALPSGDKGRGLARAESDRLNATLVIWGEIATGGVRIYFEVTPRRSEIETVIEKVSYTASELKSFDSFVFEGMRLTYIVDFIQGQLLYFENKYEEALTSFQRAEAELNPSIQKEVKAVNLFVFMGRCFGYLKDPQTALEYYTRALALDPTNYIALNNRGVAYVDLGQYENGLADYERAIEINPSFGPPYNNRGNIYSYFGDYTRAIGDFIHAIRLDYTEPILYYNIGDNLSLLEHYKSAVEMYNIAISEGENLTYGFFMRGMAYFKLGEYTKALEDFRNAFKLDNTYAPAIYGIGIVYGSLDNEREAIAQFTEAIALWPDYLEPYMGLSSSYFRLGNCQQALLEISKVIKLEPRIAEAYFDRGIIEECLRKMTEAIEDYTQAITSLKDYAEAYANRGGLFTDVGDPARARADCLKAMRLDPSDSKPYNCFGNAVYALGDYEYAIIAYTYAIEIDKNNSTFFTNRGLAFDSLKQYDDAIADFSKAIEIDPNNVDALLSRARAYFLLVDSPTILSDYQQIIDDCSQVLNLTSSNVEAYLYRGLAYYGINENGFALNDLREYARLAGDQAIPQFLDILTELEAELITPTPSPTPPPVSNALFPDGTTITLPGPRPVTLLTDPLTGNPSVFCTPSTEATVGITRQLQNGTRWVQLECDGGTGWIDESKLPQP